VDLLAQPAVRVFAFWHLNTVLTQPHRPVAFVVATTFLVRMLVLTPWSVL